MRVNPVVRPLRVARGKDARHPTVDGAQALPIDRSEHGHAPPSGPLWTAVPSTRSRSSSRPRSPTTYASLRPCRGGRTRPQPGPRRTRRLVAVDVKQRLATVAAEPNPTVRELREPA